MSQDLSNLLRQSTPELRHILATTLRLTLELDQETRLLIIQQLEDARTCPHHHTTRICNVCNNPASATCCHARDPAIRVFCQNCPWQTLA